MEQPILSGLTAYNTEGCYPWHMPGHKRRLNTIFPDIVENPFSIDVTEVGDLDEFHDPHGIISEAMNRAAEVYGSHKSYYLVNGSTCGIMAALSAVCRPGDKLIVARNCHKSVYNAIRLLQLRPIYIMPEWNEKLGMFGGVSPEQVRKMVKQYTDAKCVMLVSPTYEGVVSDVEKIAKIVHKAGVPLIVDEAHGAHFEFMSNVNETISTTNYKNIPNPAIRLGADIVIESLHKTLPAMTQCAILHEKSNIVDTERLEEYLSIYQSTSPSYVFLATTEACIEKMNYERDGLFIIYKELLSEYRKRFAQLSHIHLVEESDFKKQSACGYDDGKLVFSVKDCGYERDGEIIAMTGTKLGTILQEEYGQMMEMAAGNYVIAMTSVADSKEAFESLYLAMESIDAQLTDVEQSADTILYKTLPEHKMNIAEAREHKRVDIPFEDAIGKISGSYIYVYPPGIPIVTPGEVLSLDVMQEIKAAMDSDLNIKGITMDEKGRSYVNVIRENRWLSRIQRR
mgnify:FL=1